MDHMKSLPQKWAHISHFPPALKARMKNHFNRRFYTPPEHDSWEGYALNPNLDLAQISADFKAGKVVVIDGLLTPACLKAMKRIGSEGQVWHETKLGDYVGTGPFGPAPLAKLAEELELGLPGVFGEHTLHMHWGFKHDSQRGPRGIQVHADAAAINLNFWVTEDEANQAPDSATHGGGLTISKETREGNARQIRKLQSPQCVDGDAGDTRQGRAHVGAVPGEPGRHVPLELFPPDPASSIQTRIHQPPDQFHPLIRLSREHPVQWV